MSTSEAIADHGLDVIRMRFEMSIAQLRENFERVLAEVAERPRHNEKIARVRKLVGVLEQAANECRVFVADHRDQSDDLSRLLGLMEKAGEYVQWLAAENQMHPGSAMAKAGAASAAEGPAVATQEPQPVAGGEGAPEPAAAEIEGPAPSPPAEG